MALVLQNHCIVGYGDFSLMWSSPVLNLERGKSRSSRAFIVCFFKKHRRARQKCNALPEPSEINHFNVAGASGAVNRTGRAAHDQTHGKDVLLRLFDRVAANGFRYQLRRHGADFSNRLADGGK